LSLDSNDRANYHDAMRYFFDIVGGSELHSDEYGRDLRTFASAQRFARMLAAELRKGGRFCGSSFVRVVDEDDQTVLECPVVVQ